MVRDVNVSKRGPVAILPIFRSEAQYRLMGELFTNPGKEFTVGELAALIEASHPTVSREAGRLEQAGLITSREQGRRRLVMAATNTPVYQPLRDLLSRVYGVPAVIQEEFQPLGGRTMIFGSWAARWRGQPGPTPQDVDVLVIGDVEPTAAWDAAARATRRLEMEVNVVLRTDDEWAADDTGFAATVKAGPTLEVPPASGLEPVSEEAQGRSDG